MGLWLLQIPQRRASVWLGFRSPRMQTVPSRALPSRRQMSRQAHFVQQLQQVGEFTPHAIGDPESDRRMPKYVVLLLKSNCSVICKHWLRGLCKKGAACEFSHEYNLRGMPECVSYSRHLTCPNGADCLYLHLDPDQKAPPCEHYERGFCPLGPFCAARHVKRKTICRFWMAGFCPNGKDCNEGGHPRWREKEELKRPEVKVVLSEEEKETERERLRAKMEREREEEERPPYLDKAGQQNQHRQQGRSRGRKNWNRQRRDRY